jgi:hypothetical protein
MGIAPDRGIQEEGTEMDAWVWIVIAVIVIAAIALVAWSVARKRRTDALRGTFGSEYDRATSAAGGRRAGEAELTERVKRREELDIRPLAPAAVERYTNEWQAVQGRFVDSPEGSLGEADRLVTSVMRERGYPMDDFDQRSADISVDHADVVDDYRAAHAISLANDHGKATTEDLRQAMVHYRSLFERMVEIDRDTSERGVR